MVGRVCRKLHEQILAQSLASFVIDLAVYSEYRRVELVYATFVGRQQSLVNRPIY